MLVRISIAIVTYKELRAARSEGRNRCSACACSKNPSETGGHISSIVFRRGIVDASSQVSVEPRGRFSGPLEVVVAENFEKVEIVRRMQALGAWTENIQATMALVGDRFDQGQLSVAIDEIRAKQSVSKV
jgi:hypothetical protein